MAKHGDDQQGPGGSSQHADGANHASYLDRHQYAEAMRKQNAKAATQGTYQPDCIPLGNTGRARVADALGHAKEIHTKQTSSYVYDERLCQGSRRAHL